MKFRIVVVLFSLLFSATMVFGKTIKTEKVKVSGKCGMCESRIEKAGKSVKGVSAADWDKSKQELTVTYDADKTKMEKIEKAIANVGHDTANQKASDDVYNALPGCCKYR